MSKVQYLLNAGSETRLTAAGDATRIITDASEIEALFGFDALKCVGHFALTSGYIYEDAGRARIDFNEAGERVEICEIGLWQPFAFYEDGEPYDYEIIGYRECENGDETMFGF